MTILIELTALLDVEGYLRHMLPFSSPEMDEVALTMLTSEDYRKCDLRNTIALIQELTIIPQEEVVLYVVSNQVDAELKADLIKMLEETLIDRARVVFIDGYKTSDIYITDDIARLMNHVDVPTGTSIVTQSKSNGMDLEDYKELMKATLIDIDVVYNDVAFLTLGTKEP